MKIDATAALTASLIRRIEVRDDLSAAERAILQDAIGNPRIVAAGEDIVRDGERPHHSTLVVSGIAARYTVLPGGQRQITALHLPGDFVDLHSFLLKTMDHGVLAISLCRVATAPHGKLTDISINQPHLMRLLWLLTLLDGALHREWLVGMGRRTAISRFAHLVCELNIRLQSVGAAEGDTFDLPVTQSDLGDMLGLSTVHVNRVLQELRSERIIAWRGTKVSILDWERLAVLAEFDDRYLHLVKEPR